MVTGILKKLSSYPKDGEDRLPWNVGNHQVVHLVLYPGGL